MGRLLLFRGISHGGFVLQGSFYVCEEEVFAVVFEDSGDLGHRDLGRMGF